MKPHLTTFTLVSLDGKYASIPLDAALYYECGAEYEFDAVLVGADTALTGAAQIPDETEADCLPPERDPALPWMVLIDSRARLQGKLHVYRAMPYCRDVAVVVSASTPPSYIQYLKDRGYRYLRAGEQRVDLAQALELLQSQLGIARVRADTGGVLTSALIDAGLVDEIMLILAPLLAGDRALPSVFDPLEGLVSLRLVEHRALRDGHLLLRYRPGSSMERDR